MRFVELALQRGFARLAALCAARPVLVSTLTLLVLTALGFGVFNIEIETDVLKLWVDDSTSLIDVSTRPHPRPSPSCPCPSPSPSPSPSLSAPGPSNRPLFNFITLKLSRTSTAATVDHPLTVKFNNRDNGTP